MEKNIFSIILAGIWITFSEFIRNEILFKNFWVNHYESIGLQFETMPINGFLWMIWSIALAYLIYSLLQKHSFKNTIFLSWLSSFFMMWIGIYNLKVLPLALLVYNIPLSIFEIFVAAKIIRKLTCQ